MHDQETPINVYLHLCAAPEDERLTDEVEKHLMGALDPTLGVRVTREKQILAGTDTDSERRAQIEQANLVVLLVSADFLASDACRIDMKLALERHDSKTATVVPVICRACLWQEHAFARLQVLPRDKEPIQDGQIMRDAALRDVAEGLRALLPMSGVRAPPCPFPGLLFFDEERVADFFGREAEVDDALVKLAEPLRWLQIDGPSGAGKSSLARAGIVPAVRAGKLAGRANAWVTAVLRPGQDPIANLAEALVRHAKPPLAVRRSLDAVTQELLSSPTALKSLLRECVPKEHGMLLVVDQLEEAFTLAHADESSVQQFDALLAAALDDHDRPFVLVTTIRSDFVAKMGELPALENRLSKLQVVRFYLPEMDEAGLRAAIEKPAKRAGISYEAGLVGRIVEDASKSRGALPMVAHVLEALYARREGLTLTLGAYELVGRVGGALAKSADAVMDGLDEQDRGRARKLLLRLVKVGRASEDAPQTAPREAVLGAAGGGPEAERVLARLSGGRAKGLVRLVVVSREAGTERVDLVHDALIHQWATLRAWLKDERETLELRDDVEDAARIWEASGKDESLLPKGASLARLARVERKALTERAREYLCAADQKREAAERRQRRVIGSLVAVVLGLVIMTVRSILLAQELEASKRAQIREANRNMATMVAGTVQSQLNALSDAVKRVAAEEDVARALQNGNWSKLQGLCESTYKLYDDPSRGLKLNGRSPFNLWFIVDKNGIDRAQFGKSGSLLNLGKDYAWRDYFKGAWAAAGKGLRSTYISRTYKSEDDDFYKFSISAPVYGDDGRPAGVIIAGVASDAKLGSLDRDDTQSTVVLAAPRDRERSDPKPASPYLILRHPAIAYGEGIGMDNEQVRRVSEADSNSEAHIERPLWLPNPDLVTSSDHYQDPVAKTHPAYEGNWLSGFAPVGHTGFVVIVQTREAEVASGTNLFWQLARWAGISSIPAALFFLFTASYGRRRRSGRASSSPGRARR